MRLLLQLLQQGIGDPWVSGRTQMGYPLWPLDHLESWQVSWKMIDVILTQMGQPLWVFSPPQISRRWEGQSCTILQSTHYLCRQFFNESIYKSTKFFVGIWSISYLSSTWLYIWHLATLGRAGWNNNILWGSEQKNNKKANILERSPHSCHDNVDEILLLGASAMRSSGQTDGHRTPAYDIESKFKIPTILKNKSELLQSHFFARKK